MAIAYVQRDDWYNVSASTTAVSAALNTTSGNLIIVTISGYGSAVAAVTGIADTASNTYTKAIGEWASVDANMRQEIWYAKDITGNASNVTTVTFTGSNPYRHLTVSEYSGANTSAPLDDTGSNNNASTTSHTSGNATASEAGCLQIGACWGGSTPDWTVGSGYSTLTTDMLDEHLTAEYKVQGAAAAYAATNSCDVACTSLFLTAIFKAAPANVTVSPSAIALSLTETSPLYLIDVGSLSLSGSLNVPTATPLGMNIKYLVSSVQYPYDPQTKGMAGIATRFPVATGIHAAYQTQQGRNTILTPKNSVVPKRSRQGL